MMELFVTLTDLARHEKTLYEASTQRRSNKALRAERCFFAIYGNLYGSISQSAYLKQWAVLRYLFVGYHLSNRGDTLFNPGDLLRPSASSWIWIGYSGSVLPFSFGEMLEQYIQSVLQCRAGHD
jgi:hypothetical protein